MPRSRPPLTRDAALDYLAAWRLVDAPPEEMRSYLQEAICRLVAVARELMDLPAAARVLEVGGNPYYLTLLLREARPDLRWQCTNWFGVESDGRPLVQVVIHEPTRDVVAMSSAINNVERDPLPFDAEAFDCVVFSEVLEHLFENPARSLEHIHHVLEPGGRLVVTTPNPSRLRNIAKLVSGRTIFDAISGYGPHGRHNREYTASEITELLDGVGYDVEQRSTLPSGQGRRLTRLAAALGYGDYHFFLARRRGGAPRPFRPHWLYRSFHDAAAPGSQAAVRRATAPPAH